MSWWPGILTDFSVLHCPCMCKTFDWLFHLNSYLELIRDSDSAFRICVDCRLFVKSIKALLPHGQYFGREIEKCLYTREDIDKQLRHVTSQYVTWRYVKSCDGMWRYVTVCDGILSVILAVCWIVECYPRTFFFDIWGKAGQYLK